VTKVEGQVISLEKPVPVGAEVFATFWHSILVDEKYTIEVATSGPSGVGTYLVYDSHQRPLHTPQFGTKGPALTGVTVQFPGGSEVASDVHFEGGTSGALEEPVTVTFADEDATIAKYTANGSAPYAFVNGESDRARFLVDSTPLAGGAAGIDLSAPHGISGLGFNASLLGSEITYSDTSGNTTYDVLAGLNDDISIDVDGVVINAVTPAQLDVDASAYVEAINAAAKIPRQRGLL